MKLEQFDVVKFISRGSYSIVYEAVYTRDADNTTTITTKTCALKRVFLQNYAAIQCALREHHILLRLAQAGDQSPFLGTLFQSFRICSSPTFVMRKGSGFDLQDVLANVGFLGRKAARFYSCEIICGLEHLHAMRIVHLDVKPSNMLLSDSGHLFITDFDRSYDMSWESGPPNKADFTGTPFFMAPEVKARVEITTKADVWSLGILMGCIMYGSVTVENWLRNGRHREGRFPKLSKPLQDFFKACLTHDHRRRVDIAGVKCLKLYEGVNWEEVMVCNMEPPYHPSKLHLSAALREFNLDPHDPLLLKAAYDTSMPLIDRCLRDTHDGCGVRRLITIPPDYKNLARAGMTPERIDGLFANFAFNNHHLQSTEAVDRKQTTSADENV
ncbi:agc family protein kinase [Echinococcus multilocularis]|uniref:Agc family protein kinase n=2 Tax=Echinococcus multilocularis TaxID=6211 RepID=A0A068Y3R9_ECHMU|nr:agc family protein kinase [Echinococcus multilocularis]